MRGQSRIIGRVAHVARTHPATLNPFSANCSVCQQHVLPSAAERVTCYASSAGSSYEDRDRQEKYETKRLMDDAEARMQEIIARVCSGHAIHDLGL